MVSTFEYIWANMTVANELELKRLFILLFKKTNY